MLVKTSIYKLKLFHFSSCENKFLLKKFDHDTFKKSFTKKINK